ARRSGVDQCWLQPRLPDPARHAHRGAHLGRLPVSVRYRPNPRVRRNPVGGPDVEPVHLDLRLEDPVRAGAVAPASSGNTVHLAMHIFKNTTYDFLRWRWYAIGVSWLVIIAGAALFATWGIPLGIEFAGGTSVVIRFDQTPSVQQIRSALDRHYPGGGQNTVVQLFGDASQRQVMIRVPQVGAESGAALSSEAEQVEAALKQGNVGNFQRVGTEIIGPAVGAELRTKGLSATILSLAGILLYIAFRFQLSFAVGAVVATIHDLLITLAFLTFFRYDMSLNVIAAILTITGFSTNDTIVIFDRIRENLR